MTITIRQLTMAELEVGLEHVQGSRANDGVLEMIVRRPSSGVREELAEARSTVRAGPLPAISCSSTWI